jgi:hypothetical protein
MNTDGMKSDAQGNKISLHFGLPKESFAVEKSEGGVKHRYLCGIASGPKRDAQGERVTERCIASMSAQAQAGDLLLFPDIHGIGESKDIGILTHFKVLPGGEWYVEFRLYDESDEVPQSKLDVVDTLWKQINGLPPYTKPKKKGFSIEGYIPTEGGVQKREERGDIDEIVIQGAIVTPTPAYQDSIIHAVYKALGEKAPWAVQKDIKSRLTAALTEQEMRNAYDRERWNIQNALDEMVQAVMRGEEGTDKKGALLQTFDEYRDLMVEMILNSAAIFDEDGAHDNEPGEASPYPVGDPVAEATAKLRVKVNELAALVKEINHG